MKQMMEVRSKVQGESQTFTCHLFSLNGSKFEKPRFIPSVVIEGQLLSNIIKL